MFIEEVREGGERREMRVGGKRRGSRKHVRLSVCLSVWFLL